MTRILPIALCALLLGGIACKKEAAPEPSRFVTVGDDGQFHIGDSVYNFIGANFWYGAILGSEGRGGDRNRLMAELNLMQDIGIDNIRVLVGGDGEENIPSHVMPVLQFAPGAYNDTILDGLDFLMAELERRDMKAVLYLNNAWEWSGGYGTYLEWAGESPTPNPSIDGYQAYMERASHFVHNERAKQMAAEHVNNIVTRTNRYTGQPYSESPALMTWEIANEPRAFASDSLTKALFKDWVLSTARQIKQLDPNHLVSTGSEGLHGCEGDLDLWAEIHNSPEIDYAIIHLWPYNWGWITAETAADSTRVAVGNAYEYIKKHADRTNKPLVLEEFGYPRDGMAYQPGTSTFGRDRFYREIFRMIDETDMVQGCNIWAWGGIVTPPHDTWQPWDPYTGDPAQEAQGLNSVFASDHSTLDLIKHFSKK
ncbi:MAG: cellulase family glycosylhydrolase [Bacteroidales bacterium]|nr:cellulase family glycosylhydrolase [Bacteroidales bacterium]